jgi:O-acetyl-ADP-ribose deacetylase (regulator of RNase III)
MKLEYIKGDATLPAGNGNKIIVHVCNDMGGWGRGFVLALSARWKAPEERYREWYQSKVDFVLGQVQFVKVEDDIWVANIIGQKNVRADKYGNPPVRYEAISEALSKVAGFAKEKMATVHMPRIGCGLAGGKWELMEPVIMEKLVDNGVCVTVYDF